MDSASQIDGLRTDALGAAGRLPHELHVPRMGMPAEGKLPGAAITRAEVEPSRAANQEPVRPTAASNGGVKPTAPQTFDDHAINGFTAVERFGNLAWNIPLVAIPAYIVGKLAGGLRAMGLKKLPSWLETYRMGSRAFTESTHDTLEKLSVTEIFKAPEHLLSSASRVLKGEKLSESAPDMMEHHLGRFADPLQEMSVKVGAKMARHEQRFNEMTAKSRADLDKAVTEFGKSDLANGINAQTKGLFAWRGKRAEMAFTKKIANAHKALGQAPQTFWQRITLQKPQKIEVPEFSQVQALLHSAGNATGRDAAATLTEAVDTLGKIASDNKNLASHASKLQSKIFKAASAAEKSAHFGEVLKGGAEQWLRNAGHAAGKTKLMTALIGLGVVGTAGAATFLAKKGNHEASKQFKDLKADLGSSNSDLLKATRVANIKNEFLRGGKALLDTAGSAVFLHGNASPAALTDVMPIQMALSSAGMMLNAENAVLTAHESLRVSETGQVPLDSKGKIDAMKQLVAAVPEVKAQGGIYNRLTSDVAEALVDKMDHGMKVAAVMQLLDNKASFRAFATEVKAKQSAAQAPKDEAATANDNMHAANDHDGDAATTKAPMISANPHIAADTVKHMGMIAAETAMKRA